MEELINQQALQQWYGHIEQFRLPVLQKALCRASLKGVGLEVGAGTFCLASTLTRKKEVEKMKKSSEKKAAEVKKTKEYI